MKQTFPDTLTIVNKENDTEPKSESKTTLTDSSEYCGIKSGPIKPGRSTRRTLKMILLQHKYGLLEL